MSVARTVRSAHTHSGIDDEDADQGEGIKNGPRMTSMPSILCQRLFAPSRCSLEAKAEQSAVLGGIRQSDVEHALSRALSQARPISHVRTLPCPPPRRATTENQLNEPPNLAHVVLAAHLRPSDVVAPSAAARAVAGHVQSKPGLRARAIGGANGGSPRCARMATITLLSEMSATIARLPAHPHAKTSTK